MRGKIVNSFRDLKFFDHFPYKMIIFPRILENVFFRRLKNARFSKIQIRFRKILIFWKAEDLYFRLVTFLGRVCWTQKSPIHYGCCYGFWDFLKIPDCFFCQKVDPAKNTELDGPPKIKNFQKLFYFCMNMYLKSYCMNF